MEMKTCPHCGKEIQKEAILCKYCHSLLVEQNDANDDDSPANGDTIIFRKTDIAKDDDYVQSGEYEDDEELDTDTRQTQRTYRRRDDDEDYD
ncbi:MAG: zinc-ribbon domain-containing protein, partial [Ruminococcus sp.]|nr:zinc-ribbon domain-containing protein [Ruminococcus sp.]